MTFPNVVAFSLEIGVKPDRLQAVTMAAVDWMDGDSVKAETDIIRETKKEMIMRFIKAYLIV